MAAPPQLARLKHRSVVAARKVGAAAMRASTPAPPRPSLAQIGAQPVRTSIQLRDLPPQLQPQLEQQAGLHPALGPMPPGVVGPGTPTPPPAPPSVHVHVHLPRRSR